jgi:hypothetical protein
MVIVIESSVLLCTNVLERYVGGRRLCQNVSVATLVAFCISSLEENVKLIIPSGILSRVVG